jgi:hypothetical protein
MSAARRLPARYKAGMTNFVALAAALLWIAANLYLWSLKQEPLLLFWESLGMAAVAFPALFWFVTRAGK